MNLDNQEFEISLLRNRLREFQALLEISYNLISDKYTDELKKKETIESLKKKLNELGIGEKND